MAAGIDQIQRSGADSGAFLIQFDTFFHGMDVHLFQTTVEAIIASVYAFGKFVR